ncbi:hypothetical protein EAH68_02555 [Corynebacterium hylobatis]|uniref:DUF6194 domain-containing protein n=1 Tax=Corynebacterium hylobatis TaxID=1859290 RepID=A0A430I219_9CORY|nr:DUF6194 family protein [Corynebacterium hylobatis]RSZ65647.1 hypothetical protein EAH68_02555 [Corynebacterium hylobatis]
MSMEQVLETIRNFPGVMELAPQTGSEHPEVSWGDHFFYYAPDGELPTNRQPYATIITDNYPDDTGSHLDLPDRWRLNIHVGRAQFAEILGFGVEDIDSTGVDFGVADVFFPHPLYGAYGWISVVNPGDNTLSRATAALLDAHLADQSRVERR